MTAIDIEHIREELSHFLRNSDIFGATSTTIRGCATITDSFTATANQTAFQLTKTSIRNIRGLTVQSVAKYLFRDFTYNGATGVVTLNTGATLSDAVVIQYDWGTGSDKIYPDFPRDDLSLASFPRVGIAITNLSTEPIGLGGMTHISDILITIFCLVPSNKATDVAGGFGATDSLSDLHSTIRSKMRLGAKGFFNFTWIVPMSMNPITKGQNNKIIMQGADYRARFVLET